MYYYNAYPYPTNGYRQSTEEDEWDRSTVLDPLWEVQQKKTFTAWVNSHLRKAGTRIEDLGEDFQNGLKLMLLLEVISGQALPRPDKGRTRFHKIANINKALEYIRRKGVKLVSLDAEAIADGNQKMILGLIWTLILRFAIQNISVGDLSARDGLLLWCQRKTEPYNNVDVQNFSSSWRDGLAFCALIHRHRPELIDYDNLNPNNPVHNLNLAFDVAEKHLNIPPMLDPQDICYPNWPDEISSITYLSSLYHAFENPNRSLGQLETPKKLHMNGVKPTRSTRSMTPLGSSYYSPPLFEPTIIRQQTPTRQIRHQTPIRQIRQMTPIHMPSPMPPNKPIVLFACDPKALERAANRVADELDADKENKKLADDYGKLASDLHDWAKKWTPWFQNRPEDHSLDDANQRLNDFRNYRLKEKPPRVEDNSNLENLHNTLQTKLKLNNKPPFQPKNDQLIEDINNAWEKLELSEKGFEEWLLSEIARLERLEHLARKFQQKCDFYSEWSNEKDKLLLNSDDYKSLNLHDLKRLRKKHEFFETEIASHQERVEQIISIAKELARLHYPNQSIINRKCGEICDDWKTLNDLANKRQNSLAEMEKALEDLDDLHLKFASLATPFNNWASSTQEDLVDMVIVSEMKEIEQLLIDHKSFKETLPEADNSMKEIMDLQQQIQSIGQRYGLDSKLLKNPYTDLKSDQLSDLWTKVQNLVPHRNKELEKEYSRQKNNDYLKQVFVDKSNHIGPWLEKQIEMVLSIGLSKEEPQKSIEELNQIKVNTHEKREQFNDLEKIHQQLQENFVRHIPNAKYTMESLRVGVETLLTSINKTINIFENQILIDKSKNVDNVHLLNEYRQSFDHFDKDRKQGLNEEQLKSFLISIGHNSNVQDEKLKNIMNELDVKKTGFVDFDSIMSHLNLLDNKNTSTRMCDAFRVLAGGRSHIKAEDIRRELSSKHAEHCLQAMDKFFDHTNGGYNYEAFCKSFYSQ